MQGCIYKFEGWFVQVMWYKTISKNKVLYCQTWSISYFDMQDFFILKRKMNWNNFTKTSYLLFRCRQAFSPSFPYWHFDQQPPFLLKWINFTKFQVFLRRLVSWFDSCESFKTPRTFRLQTLPKFATLFKIVDKYIWQLCFVSGSLSEQDKLMQRNLLG